MKITCYSWTDCCHTEHKNEAGQRVGIAEVLDPNNRPIENKFATFACPACTDPDGDQDGMGIRPVQRSGSANAAPIQTPTTGTSVLDPIVNEFIPSVQEQSAQSVPFVTGSQYDSTTSHNDDYATYNLYADFSTSDNEPIPHTTPHGAFYPAAGEPNPFPNAHTQIRATERQQCTYYDYPHDDVEGLIVSHNSLPINNHTHNYATTQEMMPYGSFTPTEPIMPYNSSLTRQNASMAAASKKDAHKPRKACPDGNPNCHWEYARWCHNDPTTCIGAHQAITAAFHAHGRWKDAPQGWNEVHEPCVRALYPTMCPFHAQIYRKVMGSSFN